MMNQIAARITAVIPRDARGRLQRALEESGIQHMHVSAGRAPVLEAPSTRELQRSRVSCRESRAPSRLLRRIGATVRAQEQHSLWRCSNS